MVIKIKSKTFKNNQYQSREESKTTILLDKALVVATKKLQRTIRTLRVTRNEIRYLERIKFSCFIRRIVCNMRKNLLKGNNFLTVIHGISMRKVQVTGGP